MSYLDTRKMPPVGTRRLLRFAVVLPVLVAFLCTAPGVWAYRQSDESAVDYAAQTLRVNVWVDKEADDVYQRGEHVNVFFETNADAYAVVYRIDTEGEVTVLWPRSRFDDGFVFGQHPYHLPASGARQIRAAGESGVGYVEAIVSVYPFDLRDLELDFHHEPTNGSHNFYVAGDPFLAMNEVNFAVTGLEDSAEFVVTNYASYYVHQRVEHPRYLCNQCHFDDDVDYHPYNDHCSVTVHYDYDWGNRWYLSYGYFPVYHYPVYYYVDPWGHSPWVNYWYHPWYRWPSVGIYDWPHHCYSWHHSPYYHGDSWTRYKDGHRRYRPLDKTAGTRHAMRKDAGHNGLVRKKELSQEKTTAMKNRTSLTKKGRTVGEKNTNNVFANDKTGYRNVKSVERTRVVLRGDKSNQKDRTRGGLRIRDTRTGGKQSNIDRRTGKTIQDPRAKSSVRGKTVNKAKGSMDRSTPGAGQVRDRSRNSERKSSGDRGAIKPVETRKSGSRIWNGGRTAPSSNRKAKPQQVRPDNSRRDGSRSGKKVDRPAGSRRSKPRVESKKKSSSGSSGSRGSKIKPTSRPKSSAGSSQRKSGSSSRKSGGSSRSGGSSKSKSSGGSSQKSSGGKSRR